MAKDNDCIFCKIVKGDIPSKKVYEDDDYVAFLDIRPLNPGHTLVIPKKHYRWVWDVDDMGGYYETVKKVALGIKEAMDTDYVVSLVFGEEVPHAHVWLVPRLENDGHGSAINLRKRKKLNEEQMNEIQKRIKKALE